MPIYLVHSLKRFYREDEASEGWKKYFQRSEGLRLSLKQVLEMPGSHPPTLQRCTVHSIYSVHTVPIIHTILGPLYKPVLVPVSPFGMTRPLVPSPPISNTSSTGWTLNKLSAQPCFLCDTLSVFVLFMASFFWPVLRLAWLPDRQYYLPAVVIN